MLHAGDRPPVMGIIERLSIDECYVRSLVPFENGMPLEFELIVHGGAHAKVTGSVSEARDNPPRRHYVLRLDRREPAEADALVRAIAELHARQSTARTVQGGGALARSSVRVHVDLPVGYALEGGGIGHGRAVDLSAGGMLMVCEPLLTVGGTLELSFALPEAPGGTRRELTLQARIVAHQQTSTGTWANHLAFFHVDDSVRAEIAAFIGR